MSLKMLKVMIKQDGESFKYNTFTKKVKNKINCAFRKSVQNGAYTRG